MSGTILAGAKRGMHADRSPGSSRGVGLYVTGARVMASVLAANQPPTKAKPVLFSAAAILLAVFALIGVALLVVGPQDHPGLHIALGVGMCVLSVALALMLWEMGRRLKRLAADQEAQ